MGALGFIGGQEILIILLVVLLLFGGKKIPELMRGLGKGMREYKNAVRNVEDELNPEDDSKNSDSKDETNEPKA